jgi:CRP-like cAMP-binding protein
MKISLAAGEPNGQVCAECSVRQFNICAAHDKSELRELEHLGRHAHFTSGETVFAQEEVMTSVYNLLEGLMRPYKLLPDGRRQIVGFALPGDFLGTTASARHGFSADAVGSVSVCKIPERLCMVYRGQARICCDVSMNWPRVFSVRRGITWCCSDAARQRPRFERQRS